MALYYDLQIYKNVHSLMLLVFQYTKEFHKEYKLNLGEDMRRDSIGRQINGWRKSFR